MFTAASGLVVAAHIHAILCALCLGPKHQYADLMCRCLLAVTSLPVVFYVWEVGSGKIVLSI